MAGRAFNKSLFICVLSMGVLRPLLLFRRTWNTPLVLYLFRRLTRFMGSTRTVVEIVKLFLLLLRVGPARKEEGGFRLPTEKRVPLAAPMGDAFQGDFDGTAGDGWLPRSDC
jgi:hypothetical protein